MTVPVLPMLVEQILAANEYKIPDDHPDAAALRSQQRREERRLTRLRNYADSCRLLKPLFRSEDLADSLTISISQAHKALGEMVKLNYVERHYVVRKDDDQTRKLLYWKLTT